MTYLEQVIEDVRNYINENYEEGFTEGIDKDDISEKLYEDLWIEDSVTGNGSGSYTFSRAKAKEYVDEDPDTVREALKEFCVPAEEIGERFLDEDYEYLDVTARCYVLGEAIETVLSEYSF